MNKSVFGDKYDLFFITNMYFSLESLLLRHRKQCVSETFFKKEQKHSARLKLTTERK